MASRPFRTVLVDFDEDLFAPPPGAGEILVEHDIPWVVGQFRTSEAALEAARDADVVMIQSLRPILNREVIEELDRCRCIVRLGIGYDNVDVRAASEKGILVCNVPFYCIEDVAQHALALLLDGVRHIAKQDRWIRDGRWDRTGARPTRRMRGCTLGLIGFGRIARALVQQVKGFDMTVLAYDPYVDATVVAGEGARKVDLDELLGLADLVSVHCPLTAETRHLLSTDQFEQMKDGVFLVNTSRGPIIDEDALAKALAAGKLWGVGLDVFEQEPLAPDSPLRTFDQVTLTPHVGANSEDSVAELYRTGCEIALDVFSGRWPNAVVNPEVWEKTHHVYQRFPQQ